MTVIEVTKLNKSFGKKRVLKDISFSFSQGEVVGLVGANGAGKTTLMKAILSLTAFEGEIKIDGQEVTFNHHSALEHVGALIEYPGLYPYLTGRDHLKLFATGSNAKTKIESIITRLNLSSYIDIKTKKYSLGMKQKLGLALALLNNPKLVILDEPINGLDPQASREVRNVIKEEADKGTSFLISSHILGELQKIAGKIILIQNGVITKETTVTELIENGNRYYILKTSDDQKAKNMLEKEGYNVSSTLPLNVYLEDTVPIGNVIAFLSVNNINVINIEKHSEDLEDSILNVISSKEEEN